MNAARFTGPAGLAPPNTTSDPSQVRRPEPHPASDGRTPSARLLRPGEIVGGNYRIEHAIDHPDEWARVYRATQLSTQRSVALKVLLTRYSHRPDVIARVREEGRAVARIQHPNVVTLHDIGFDRESRIWLAMEYLEAPTLRTLLRTRELSLDEKLRIISQIAAAVAAGHRADIVHGDLKPENIFVYADLLVKVVDFRTAAFLSESSDKLRSTPLYAAPELFYKGHVPSFRTDLYAVAAIADELLRGRHWRLTDRDERPAYELVAWRALERSPSRIPGLPGSLAEVVLTGLRARPNDRQESVEEFASQLARAACDQPRPELTVHQRPTPASRRRVRVYSALVGLVMGAVLGTVVYLSAQPTRGGSTQAASQPRPAVRNLVEAARSAASAPSAAPRARHERSERQEEQAASAAPQGLSKTSTAQQLVRNDPRPRPSPHPSPARTPPKSTAARRESSASPGQWVPTLTAGPDPWAEPRPKPRAGRASARHASSPDRSATHPSRDF